MITGCPQIKTMNSWIFWKSHPMHHGIQGYILKTPTCFKMLLVFQGILGTLMPHVLLTLHTMAIARIHQVGKNYLICTGKIQLRRTIYTHVGKICTRRTIYTHAGKFRTSYTHAGKFWTFYTQVNRIQLLQYRLHQMRSPPSRTLRIQGRLTQVLR